MSKTQRTALVYGLAGIAGWVYSALISRNAHSIFWWLGFFLVAGAGVRFLFLRCSNCGYSVFLSNKWISLTPFFFIVPKQCARCGHIYE